MMAFRGKDSIIDVQGNLAEGGNHEIQEFFSFVYFCILLSDRDVLSN